MMPNLDQSRKNATNRTRDALTQMGNEGEGVAAIVAALLYVGDCVRAQTAEVRNIDLSLRERLH